MEEIPIAGRLPPFWSAAWLNCSARLDMTISELAARQLHNNALNRQPTEQYV